MITRKITFAPWCAMLMGLILYAAMTPPAAAAITIAVTNFRGDWDPTVNYGAGAVVTYSGQSYIAIVKNNNVVLHRNGRLGDPRRKRGARSSGSSRGGRSHWGVGTCRSCRSRGCDGHTRRLRCAGCCRSGGCRRCAWAPRLDWPHGFAGY